MSRRGYRQNNELPPRWLYCPSNGNLIEDKFIAFKTPLDRKYSDEVPDECKFNIQMFLSSVKTTFNKQVGLVVDLTNTTRYYNKDEVESAGCKYVKLQCQGHAGTPAPEQMARFINVVHKFIRSKPLEIVGVHCTHGFNRTGFLICSYLVEKMGCKIDAAVQNFALARPPGIYKGDYIKELFKIYGNEDDMPLAPILPDWCNGNYSCYNYNYNN